MLANIMSNYFSNNLNENFKPIVSHKKVNWEKSGKSLLKKFKFEDEKKYERFIVEIIKYTRENTSSIEVRFREMEVGIIIKSFSPDISSIDLRNSENIDTIRKDINFYFKKEEDK